MALPERNAHPGAFVSRILLCVLLVSTLFEATSALDPSETSPEPAGKVASPGAEAAAPTTSLGASSDEQPGKASPADAAVPVSRAKSKETTTSETETTTVAPAPTAKDRQSSDSESGAPRAKEDIDSLLASKNDSENDLAATAAAPKPVASAAAADSLDSPVDAKRGASSVGNRFHYSMGADSPADTTSTEDASRSETTTLAEGEEDEPSTTRKSTVEIFELHENSTKSDPKVAPTSISTTVEPPAAITTTQSTTSPSSSAPELSETEIKYDDKSKSIVIESVPKKTPAAPETTTVEPPKEASSAATTTTAAAAVSSTTSEPIKSESSTSSIGTEAPKEKASEPTSTVAATTTSASSKPEAPKPVDLPSAVAAAVGSAIGSALGAAVKPTLTQRGDKPAIADSSSTTQKPSSTTLKSSTDRWNRWSPSTPPFIGSSSSSSPPARRRPILPSIRRRFRPYNRLNPFPWGADSYMPGMDADYLPGFDQPPVSSSSPRPADSSKPKRRSSTTTERPKTSSRRPLGGSDDNGDDDDDGDITSSSSGRPTSSRRGESGPGRRRHHHQHDRDYRHHQHHSNREHGGEFGAGYDHHTGGHRRRHRNNQGSHHNRGHHFDHEDPLSSSFNPSSGAADIEPSFSSSRPGGAGGFPSLFNSGASSTGSGFDLLNPFSGWFDDTRPSRGVGGASAPPGGRQVPTPSHIGSPSRLPGRNPIPVEGEYNEHRPSHHHQHQSGPGRDTHIHVHGGSGRPIITGVGNDRDRDEYDYGHHGHHGHDCHEHDYDHDHHDHHRDPPYRPNGRPGREPHRPYGGEDGYSSSRPGGRPYNRRDESQLGSAASSSSSSSSATPGSVDKRERERGSHSESSDDRSEPSLHHSPLGSPTSPLVGLIGGAPRRVPSIFSPFESLFGALDDELFNLRSTFIDGSSPLRPAAATAGSRQPAPFVDAIISSPKISMPPPAVAGATSNAEKAEEAKKPYASDETDEDSMPRRQIRAFG